MASSSHPLKRLLRYGQGYGKQVNWAIACSVLNKVFDLAPPILIGVAVDVVVQREHSLLGRWGIQNAWNQLLLLGVLTVVIWGLESAFEYAYARLWRNLAQNIQHHLRLDAYNHLQHLALAYFEERSTGEFLSILSEDINQLERFLDVGANEILQVLTTSIAVSAGFFWLSPQVAVLAMLPIPFILWGSITFQQRLAPRYTEVREKAGLLNARLANNLGGITTIKSFTTEAYEVERLNQESGAYRQSNRRAIALSAAFVPLIRIVILAGFMATLLVGGWQTLNGSLAVGAYSFLVFITQRLLWPLTRLGETLDLYQRAMASTNRVMDLLDTPMSIPSGHLTWPRTIQGEVELRQISFAYGGRQPVIHSLSLHIPAGHTIGIVGATGSGKSTLVKLLLRFYEVQSGQILIDGLDIRDLHLQELRRAIGLVSQEVFLFQGTVWENIAYGSPEATYTAVEAAAEVAEAHEFIKRLPYGYGTIVGERGQKLSGGQRQRLAIARAILKNPPILILDEATSAVDNETEAAIQRSLAQITHNRTTIAIAHRLSTIRHAHCIYVMDKGEIVEQGRHEDLLAQQNLYANLWNVQTGEKQMSI